MKIVNEPAMREMSLKEFSQRLAQECIPNGNVPSYGMVKYAFFIGSGCSYSAGIPTGSQLVHNEWMEKLHTIKGDHQKFEEWRNENFKDYTQETAGKYYSDVMLEVFDSEQKRQIEIERLCNRKNPRFEYAQLASLIARPGGQFNVVLTTNFDDLMADALYLFTNSHPLVIHHASLAHYLYTGYTRPLVVKMHGDNRLSPYNTPQELEELDEVTTRRVQDILRERSLIFIGYGGHDKGIAKMLEGIEASGYKSDVYYISTDPPGDELIGWLKRCNATHVTPGRFNQVMVMMTQALKIPLFTENKKWIDDIFQESFLSYETTAEEVRNDPAMTSAAEELKQAVSEVSERFSNWYAVELAASAARKSNPAKADDIYRAGLIQYPNSPELLCIYALFLWKYLKDGKKAETYFKKACAGDLKDASSLGNYAGFVLALGRNLEGLGLLDEAMSEPDYEARPALRCECCFYGYAHRPEAQRMYMLASLKRLLLRGNRSSGWDFNDNILTAVADSHPHANWLPKLAAVITKKAHISTLDDWPAWKALEA